jgi:hypothetical protein
MVTLIALVSMLQDELVRTPAIYRCNTQEGESKFLESIVNEDAYDTFCIEPKAGPNALRLTHGKVKFVSASVIDTKPNLLWRNATIDFVNGKISPKTWLDRTANLHETVHFLSNPKTAKLRDATGQLSHTAVFAEMFLLCWPGKPCLSVDDVGGTRYLPGPGKLESWILAMNDYRGPMLYLRSTSPAVVTGTPKIIRADAKPGLLIFEQHQGEKTTTFYLNNGPNLIEVPLPADDISGIAIGIDLEAPNPRLGPGGFTFRETGG